MNRFCKLIAAIVLLLGIGAVSATVAAASPAVQDPCKQSQVIAWTAGIYGVTTMDLLSGNVHDGEAVTWPGHPGISFVSEVNIAGNRTFVLLDASHYLENANPAGTWDLRTYC